MIYGLHDLSERGAQMGVRWFVDAVAIGHDPNDHSGADYSHWAAMGCEIICRLNNGWNPDGTIPLPELYDDYAQRCANFVQASQGCRVWVIGNEWGNKIERPHGQIVTVEQYVSCYRKVRAAIKAIAPDDWVIPAAIGPWNTESGDWLELYRDVLAQVDCEAICWHIYSHGYNPALVTDDTKMESYPDRFYNFRCYRDFEAWTPEEKRHLPVLVTEANGDGPWQATGWIPAAYKEIRQSSMDVQCLCLFRAQQTGDGYGLTEGAWAEFEQTIAGGSEPPPQEGNLTEISISNPGFEDGWREWHGIGEMKVANGWEPWWLAGTKRPEYKIALPEVDPRRIHEGQAAQQWFTTHDTHHAGIYQSVDLTAAGCQLGDPLTFTAWVQSFTRDDDTDWVICNGRYWLHVGIDPYGGLNPESSDVVWSEGARGYRWYEAEDEVRSEYMQVTATARMRADRCTLFVRGQAEWPVKHNNGYVDSCALYYEGKETPEPPEPPETPTGDGVTEERVIELINEYGTKLISGMVPGMIKMNAPIVIAEKLRET